MATRFTDDLFTNTEGSDFIVRKRIPLAVQIFLIFAIAFVAIYVTASHHERYGQQDALSS